MSKGSAPRPFSVSRERYADNYTRTFGSAVHQNPPHPDSATGTTGTQAILLRVAVDAPDIAPEVARGCATVVREGP